VKKALFSSIGHRSSPKIALALEKVRSKIPASGTRTYQHIFIDRKHTDSRVVRGKQREKLFSLLDRYNVRAIALEEHSFADQISMMRKAKVILAFHGSGVANLHFTSKRKDLIVLYESEKVRRNQSMFDEILPKHIQRHEIICPANDLDFESIEGTLRQLCEPKASLLHPQAP
jgi:capsular polysaccharide biosynthesis protein